MTKLTVLMYHKVAELPPVAVHRGNYVTPRQFEEQLDSLLAWGYRTITFDHWLAYRAGRGSVPRRPLIVTFDDGYRCFLETAWPMLRARGMGATMAVVAGQLGGNNAWDAGAPQERLLDRDEIVSLHRDGVEIASHTFTHLPLAKVAPDVAFNEMQRSRDALGELLGADVRVLSYPFSNQSRSVRDLARRAGYHAAVRGKGRMNMRRTDPLSLRRMKFDSTMSIDDVRRRLWRARWLALD
jgi:peptidoglycan/xylan/chitin deacetylase (PgdA/CDA1 family)